MLLLNGNVIRKKLLFNKENKKTVVIYVSILKRGGN